MEPSDTVTASEVKAYCRQIGKDPLLVQGPGGNISWKDGDVLWIKASGKWLAKACDEEIFIPVSLTNLKNAVYNEKFSSLPKVIGNNTLRPSIETMLHAVMPNKVVAHLHAVEVLAHLVREKAEVQIKKLIGESVKWVFVDYFKPGAELAAGIAEKLKLVPDAEVIFLKNHGILIGAADVKNLHKNLQYLSNKFHQSPLSFAKFSHNLFDSNHVFFSKFKLSNDECFNQLVINSNLFDRLTTDWALYPDHIVFLGSKPIIITKNDLKTNFSNDFELVDFIFVQNYGVLQSCYVSAAKKAQLKCYFDILSRQDSLEILCSLTDLQINELIEWDAEKYRKKIQIL
jgi:rhamnose utilization protein RhaD (predicted bifunctional aldolase and dehydrogenase)